MAIIGISGKKDSILIIVALTKIISCKVFAPVDLHKSNLTDLLPLSLDFLFRCTRETQPTEDGLSQHKERDHFILSTQPGHSFGTTNCAFSTKAAKWRASPLLPVAQPTSLQNHSCDHILLQTTSFFPTTASHQQITTDNSP